MLTVEPQVRSSWQYSHLAIMVTIGHFKNYIMFH